MLKFFKKHTTSKGVLSESEQLRISNAIGRAEMTTSGEVRVYVENRMQQLTAMDRAAEIFFQLKMDKTDLRNGVLVYVALQDRQVALFGDEGIHQKVGGVEYWQRQLNGLIKDIRKDDLCDGLVNCILSIGLALSDHFPYRPGEDKNELPDEIVFGEDLND